MDSKPVGKIRCYEKEDRKALASILTANGYVVWQGREPKSMNRKTVEYMVYFKEQDDDCPGCGKDG